MYLCPTCHKPFEDENEVVKHFLKCWKKHNPYHESTPAPHTESTYQEANETAINFFASLEKGFKNARNKT